MRTSDRIGPHDLDVVSVLVGCLLGDGYASQTKGKIVGTSFLLASSRCYSVTASPQPASQPASKKLFALPKNNTFLILDCSEFFFFVSLRTK